MVQLTDNIQSGLGLGTFRLFLNRSVPFYNEGLQLDRSIFIPLFSNCSVLVPFRPVLSLRTIIRFCSVHVLFLFHSVPCRTVLSLITIIGFCSVLCVLRQRKFPFLSFVLSQEQFNPPYLNISSYKFSYH